ncbi:MAG: succinate dehydrogenase, cytochrome b556 subunit [Candidatus Thorarchaeota archaeon]
MAEKQIDTSQTNSASSPLNSIRWLFPAKMFQRGSGYYAWLLHRITGLIIVGYIFLHLYELFALTQGSEAYNNHAFDFTQPLYLLLDVGLIAILAYHGLNGLRIILFDLGLFVNDQKNLFLIILVATAIICIIAAFVIWWAVVPFIVKETALP